MNVNMHTDILLYWSIHCPVNCVLCELFLLPVEHNQPTGQSTMPRVNRIRGVTPVENQAWRVLSCTGRSGCCTVEVHGHFCFRESVLGWLVSLTVVIVTDNRFVALAYVEWVNVMWRFVFICLLGACMLGHISQQASHVMFCRKNGLFPVLFTGQ